jgi:hypothetical protein
MAQLPGAFNPNAPGQEGIGDWTPLPIGPYQAQVEKSEWMPTKDCPVNTPAGPHFLKLDWKILAGEQAGKVMIQRLNLQNPNPVAVEIAQKHLKSICDAMGIPGPISDSNVLHGHPIIIHVKQTKETAQYGAGNDIKKYEPIGAAGAMPVAGAAIPGMPATPAAPAAPAMPGVTAIPVAPVVAPAAPTAPAAAEEPAAEEAAEVAPDTTPPWLLKKDAKEG